MARLIGTYTNNGSKVRVDKIDGVKSTGAIPEYNKWLKTEPRMHRYSWLFEGKDRLTILGLRSLADYKGNDFVTVSVGEEIPVAEFECLKNLMKICEEKEKEVWRSSETATERKGKIKIKVREFIFNGEKAVEIVSLEGFKTKGETPRKYIEGGRPFMYQDEKGVCLFSDKISGCFRYPIKAEIEENIAHDLYRHIQIKTGDVYYVELWDIILEAMKDCGENLATINKELRTQVEGWGKERIYYI